MWRCQQQPDQQNRTKQADSASHTAELAHLQHQLCCRTQQPGCCQACSCTPQSQRAAGRPRTRQSLNTAGQCIHQASTVTEPSHITGHLGWSSSSTTADDARRASMMVTHPRSSFAGSCRFKQPATCPSGCSLHHLHSRLLCANQRASARVRRPLRLPCCSPPRLPAGRLEDVSWPQPLAVHHVLTGGNDDK